MLELTDAAAVVVQGMLEGATEQEKPRLRFGVIEGELKAALDEERPGDTTIKHASNPLIVMDRVTADRLHGRKLDVDESGESLVLK